MDLLFKTPALTDKLVKQIAWHVTTVMVGKKMFISVLMTVFNIDTSDVMSFRLVEKTWKWAECSMNHYRELDF